MKLTNTISFFAALAVSVSPLAAEDADTPATDGVQISAEERATLKEERAKIKTMKAKWAEAFNYTDNDEDGIMTFDEAQAHNIKKAKKHGKVPADIRPRFDEWDANSDGVVTLKEMEAEFPSWLKARREAHKKKEAEKAA